MTGGPVTSDLSEGWTVDGAVVAYLNWRAASSAVRTAYNRWENTPREDASLAFGAYEAALDREAAAARFYAQLMARAESSVGAPVNH